MSNDRPANREANRRAIPTAADWDLAYREGLPPWEMGCPSPELVRFLEKRLLTKGSVLELGCGTGADAVLLAQQRLDVTAVDFAPTAIERARTRAQRAGVNVCFVLDDVFHFAYHVQTFDLIYDCGFYQYVRQWELSRLLDLLWRVTRPGSYYLCITYRGDENLPAIPPVSDESIRWELGRLFELIELNEFKFYSNLRRHDVSGLSALMRRPLAEGVEK
jgi:SAM-dependent methyltransferase